MDRPDDTWFYRPAAKVTFSLQNSEHSEQQESQTFLLVHQAAWQKRLLER